GYARKAGCLIVKQVEDREELVKLLRQFEHQGRTLVGYNSRSYDVPMARAIAGNRDWFALSQAIVAGDRPAVRELVGGAPRFRPDHIDISERLRRGKYPPSLKAVAVNLGRPKLEELPFDPTSPLSDEEWARVREYNAIDLGHTWALLERVTPDLESLALLSRD